MTSFFRSAHQGHAKGNNTVFLSFDRKTPLSVYFSSCIQVCLWTKRVDLFAKNNPNFIFSVSRRRYYLHMLPFLNPLNTNISFIFSILFSYIWYVTYKKNLSDNQELLELVIIPFILMTFMFFFMGDTVRRISCVSLIGVKSVHG